MKLEEALDLWRGSGFKRINGYLILEHTGNRLLARKYVGATAVEDDFDVAEVVNLMRKAMKPVDRDETYYRGASKKRQISCHVETFLSITVRKEVAEAFTDDGNVYDIQLAPGVKGIKTGIEGETVLEDGCFWEYIGNNKVLIHPPSADLDFEYCTSVIKRGGYTRKRKRNSTRRKGIKTLKLNC